MQYGRRSIGIVCAVMMAGAALSDAGAAARFDEAPLGAVASRRSAVTVGANGWVFEDVIREGEHGISGFHTARLGPNSEVLIVGVQNGKSGVFEIPADSSTPQLVTPFPGAEYQDARYSVNGDLIGYAKKSGAHYVWRRRDGVTRILSTYVDPSVYDIDLYSVADSAEWIVRKSSRRTDGAYEYVIELSDGQRSAKLLQYATRAPGTPLCTPAVEYSGQTAAGGTLAYVATTYVQFCPTHQATWKIALTGANTGDVAAGAFTRNSDGTNAVGTHAGDVLFNSSGALLASVSDAARVQPRQDKVFAVGRETVIATWPPNMSAVFMDFDDRERPIYSVRTGDQGELKLMDGSDLTKHHIIGPGDALFGDTLRGTMVARRPTAPGDNPHHAFAFRYQLTDGTFGIARARKPPTSWINANGGVWGTGSNWSEGAVPAVGESVLFNLAQTYAVDLGSQRVGGISVIDGDVTFRNGTLTISDLLSIDAERLGVVPRLNVVGPSAEVTGAVSLAGELRVDGATLMGPDGSHDNWLGVSAPATATVTNNGFWYADHLDMCCYSSRLLVEDGGLVAIENIFIGGLNGFPLSAPRSNRVATVRVDDSANASTQIGPVDELIVGGNIIGDLDVRNGGRVSAVTATLAPYDGGYGTDALVSIDGANSSRPSSLDASQPGGLGGMFAATGPGTSAFVDVSSGGRMTLSNLSLAHAADSNAWLSVDGSVGGAGVVRSAVHVADGNPYIVECVVGRGGRGTLHVTNGSLLQCQQLAIGMLSGSRGKVEVSGFQGTFADIVVAGPDLLDGVVCIGAVPACDSTFGGPRSNVRGELVLGADSYVTARTVLVGAGGQLRGTGIVSTDDGVLVMNGGRVSPGVVQLASPRGGSVVTDHVGALTINGDLTISETAVVTLQVLGASPALQDRLVVSGALNFRGKLVIEFDNRYAPKRGDVLPLIQSPTATESGLDVQITGLADGFQYRLAAAGGKLELSALNDGVPTTDELKDPTQIFAPAVFEAE